MSYANDILDNYRRAAMYADRILEGREAERASGREPVKFHLAINLKTAKTLGLTVPPILLTTADEVIE